MVSWEALTDPVSRREVRAYLRNQPRIRRSSYMSWFEISWVATMCLAVATLIFSLAADDAQEAARSAVLQAACAAVVMVMAVWTYFHRRKPHLDSIRLARFAAANGFTYLFENKAPAFPATGFGNGRDGMTYDVITRGPRQELEIGSYRALVGSGDNTRTHTWRYAQVRLRSALPHIVLDAKANGSNLQEDFVRRGQKLDLGGNLGKNFAVYCPTGYEDDVRRLFTPETCRHLAAELRSWDLEIVDDRLFLFSGARAAQAPSAVRGLLEGVTVLERYVEEWGRWRDPRLTATTGPFTTTANEAIPGMPAVAPQGRRLKSRMGWGPWIILAMSAAGIVLGILKSLGIVEY
ncbi:hypothetical protein ACSYDW_15935 [Paeniglutamicibacter sp. R2-26]|uniref:hypothetical protein n=1 Tax=Paeniglutamicibacter sp. R2-26 TaxID=3144417 RepID=UPI003EE79100